MENQDQGKTSEETAMENDQTTIDSQLNDTNIQTENIETEAEIDIETLWKERTGLTEDSLAGTIETIIFMSEHPISLQKIKTHIDPTIPLRLIHESIIRLQKEYESSHHGIRILEVAEGYQFRTKATYSRYVQEMLSVQSLQLSATSLEVLAIIAYKQPVSKSEIEKIRGVDSAHLIRGLMDKRLVKIVGRSDDLGRPTIYATTPEFLEVFNLRDLSELPPEYELQELATKKEVASISEIRTLVSSGDKTKYFQDELEELDQLANSIEAIDPETSFTKTLRDQSKSNRELPEGEKPKTAFDLLEEFITRAQVVTQNKSAMEGHGLGLAYNDPKGIDPTLAHEANWPSDEVDLDVAPNGEPEEEDIPLYPELLEDEEMGLLGEEDALSAALDKAFEDLKSRSSHLEHEDDDMLLEENLEKIEMDQSELDQTVEDMISRGKDLGLDLDFLDTLQSKEQSDEDDDLEGDVERE